MFIITLFLEGPTPTNLYELEYDQTIRKKLILIMPYCTFYFLRLVKYYRACSDDSMIPIKY